VNNSTAKTCKNCQWWDPINSVIGECRRMPPHPADNVADPRWWPGTKRDDWCGEFAEYKAKGSGKA